MYQVVIVEDDPMVAMLNRRYTEKDPRFRVCRECPDGRAALEYLRAHPADLVILDMYMPQMDGLDVLRQLRAAGVSTDVIMITAASDTATVEAAMRLGVVDYLVKPFEYERFRQALDAFDRPPLRALPGGMRPGRFPGGLLHRRAAQRNLYPARLNAGETEILRRESAI